MLAQPSQVNAAASVNPHSSWEMQRAHSIGRFMDLASATGGQRFEAISSKDVLPDILKSMAKHLRYDYVAGFYPATSGGRRKHKVEVVLRNGRTGEIVGGARTLVH